MPWLERSGEPGRRLIGFDRTLEIGRRRGAADASALGFAGEAMGPLYGRIDLQSGRCFLISLHEPTVLEVNGRPATAVPLRDGDEIAVRGTRLRFREDGGSVPDPAGASPPRAHRRPRRLLRIALLGAAAAAVARALTNP